MKSAVKKFLPSFVIDAWISSRLRMMEYRDRNKSAEDVFGDIYTRNRWGGKAGELNSGSGSDDVVILPYIEMMEARAEADGFKGSVFVDLGCGDFRVGRKLMPLCSNYIGVDIVKAVVKRNAELYGNETITFKHLDIIDEDLPDGSACTIRQVLQHLSNEQISKVISKLDKYKWVFITEHYPSDNKNILPNVDKVHGGGIRLYKNSGVYLSEFPFNIPAEQIEQVLEVRPPATSDGRDAGVIRTFLYRPRAAWGAGFKDERHSLSSDGADYSEQD